MAYYVQWANANLDSKHACISYGSVMGELVYKRLTPNAGQSAYEHSLIIRSRWRLCCSYRVAGRLESFIHELAE